jgi:hypothetical protein
MSSGDPLAAKAEEPPAPAPPPRDEPAEDETVVMPPTEQGGAGTNGADENRPAKAPAARAQDESE